MPDSLKDINLKQFKNIFPVEIGGHLDNDLFILDLRYGSNLDFLKYPCRFDGFMAVFCMTGKLRIEVNLNSYDVEEHTLLISTPGNILKVEAPRAGSLESLRFIVVAISREYLTGINFDLGKLFDNGLDVLADPCIHLKDQELFFCSKYLELAEEVVHADFPFRKEVVGSLISSLFYLLNGLWQNKINRTPHPGDGATMRGKLVFEQFMSLVTEHHASQRGMAFYADRIGLTPKYLSKLIKSATGRSAPDWINSFVILEAKNMLKYTDAPIKRIVFSLNFPNQSVFYKFFKAHTGMTPKEYRNS